MWCSTHAKAIYEALSTLEAAGLHKAQTAISYLPLAHIAERVVNTKYADVLDRLYG